jgi:hypothetical protein
MISRTAIVWILAGICMGAAMIVVKARVQGLEEELASLQTEIRAEERAVHVLKAEWSYLNQPRVLRGLAERHLGLTEMQTGQIITFDDLPFRPVPEAGPGADPIEEKQP